MALLKLPEHFDRNEWYVLLSLIVLLAWALRLRKAIPKDRVLPILLLFPLWGFTADLTIGVDYPFDGYDIMDSPKFELFDLLMYSGNYALYGYLFAYWIFRWRLRGFRLMLFAACWVLLTLFLEWTAVNMHVFKYKQGWSLSSSLVVYILVFAAKAVVVRALAKQA